MTLVDSQQGSGELSPLTELGQKLDAFGRQFFPKISVIVPLGQHLILGPGNPCWTSDSPKW